MKLPAADRIARDSPGHSAWPWTVTKTHRRESKPIWFEYVCAEGNHHVVIGKENYFVSEDGYLMPTRKGQPAPDLKFFDSTAAAGGR